MNIIGISNTLYNNSSIMNIKNTIFIHKKEELSYEMLFKLEPEYIFFPHWSYIIPKKIYENFTCIIFHMTNLPFGRGGSPLQNLLSRGIYETKISAIQCVQALDSGGIYMKRDFSIKNGSAKEIYERAGEIIADMIDDIIATKPKPIQQKGEIVRFNRRTPEMSNIEGINSIQGLYDHIRMLDCEGYPKAFIEKKGIRYEFSKAILQNDELNVMISIKDLYEKE